MASASVLSILTSGLLIALSLPPFGLDWLAWVAFVPLLADIRRSQPPFAGAFLRGAAAWLPFSAALGIGFLHTNWVIAVGYPVAACVGVGLVVASHAALLRRGLGPCLATFTLPCLWVLGEQVGAAVGTPWPYAINQVPRPWILQTASLVGGYGVSFLLLLVNGALVEIAWAVDARAGLRRLLPAALLIALAYTWGTWRLAQASVEAPSLRVASIQPMLWSELYTYQWLNPAYRETVRGVVADLSGEAADAHPDLLIWPENGNGQLNFQIPALRRAVGELAARSGGTLLLSSYEADSDGLLYNAVFSVAPDGAVLGRHAKVKLVPGREEGFAAGSTITPLPTPHGPVGALVCVESCFPWLARKLTTRGAELLLVTTSDIAMRHSILSLVHEELSVLRAVENGRWLVQASNGGRSFVVSPFGEITARTPLLTRTVLHGRVEPSRERTPYTRFGDWPLRLLIATLLVAALRSAGVRSIRGAPFRPTWGAVATLPAALALGLCVGAVSLGVIAAGRPDLGASWGAAVRTFVQPTRIEVPRDASASFLQSEPTTCGLAALAYVLNVLGFDTREADLRLRVQVGSRGTSMADLVSVARDQGLLAWGEAQDLVALRSIPKPVIAHLDDAHWVVVLAVDADEVQLFDPAIGYTGVPLSDFARRWAGRVLLVRLPPRDGASALKVAGWRHDGR